MKSLILLSFLLVAGAIPYANAQVRPQPAKEGESIQTAMFPDLQNDLANLRAREIKPKPDRSVISVPAENRLFTNYKAPAPGNNAAARTRKPAAVHAPAPSDLSVKEAADKLKAEQAAHPAKPVAVPNQGNETTNEKH